ncbi:glutaredoxin-like protein NrdH [Enterococcus raffinosus]|nr:glutaredoxin-like protein NrdH [Enterococcus raffinosus]
MTKRYLTENQISFEEVNIDNEPEALGFLKDQGFQSVPVIFGGQQAIIGFRPDQLKALA